MPFDTENQTIFWNREIAVHYTADIAVLGGGFLLEFG